MDEISRIVFMLKRTFERQAWHGPSVMEALTNVSETQSQKRLPGTHSIGELVLHMTAWRTFVIRRLAGDNDFHVTDELNFPVLTSWSDTVQELQKSQQQLLDAIRNFEPARLEERVPHGEYDYTYYTLLHGIVHHDLYHTGQIALIKKASD